MRFKYSRDARSVAARAAPGTGAGTPPAACYDAARFPAALGAGMNIRIPQFDQVRVLVAGDVMLDRYWFGAT
ncbi:MAG: hypothetical protein KGL00_00785, partial [Gammaproteobacteria bacterium]|nr:hypothetical protein [Gammaproteobacteria bacterium]